MHSLSRTATALARLEPFVSQDESGGLVGLREDVEATLGFARGNPLPLFTVELLRAITPYLEKIPSRVEASLGKTTSGARFEQVSRLLYALRASSDATHPAVILAAFETVLGEIQEEERKKTRVVQMFSHSDLARALAPAVQRQWTPVLMDTRVATSRIGSGALLLGATCVVGRLALLYPVVHVGSVAMAILAKLNPDRAVGRRVGEIDASDGLRLAKALLLLWASSKVLAVVALYTSVGFACLGAGVASLAVSKGDDAALKHFAPVLAPVVAPIADIVGQVAQQERVRWPREPEVAVAVATSPATPAAQVQWVCSKCTFENPGDQAVCEMCGNAF